MEERSFSYKWMLLSMAVFIGIELVLGGLVGELLLGRSLSMSLQFTLQGLLNLVSYFIGGLYHFHKIENLKSEARNPKQIQSTNVKKPQTEKVLDI